MSLKEKALVKIAMAFASSQDLEVERLWFQEPGVTVRLLYVEKNNTFVIGPEAEYEDAVLDADLNEEVTLTKRQELIRIFSFWDYESEYDYINAVATAWLNVIKDNLETTDRGVPYEEIELIREVIMNDTEHTFTSGLSYMSNKEGLKQKKVIYNPKAKAFQTLVFDNTKKSKPQILHSYEVSPGVFMDVGIELNLAYNFVKEQVGVY